MLMVLFSRFVLATPPEEMCNFPIVPEAILPDVIALSAIFEFITAPETKWSLVIDSIAIANFPTLPDDMLPETTAEFPM